MGGWHHQLSGHELEQAPGNGEEKGSLACCTPRFLKELDTTERLNNSNEYHISMTYASQFDYASDVAITAPVNADEYDSVEFD